MPESGHYLSDSATLERKVLANGELRSRQMFWLRLQAVKHPTPTLQCWILAYKRCGDLMKEGLRQLAFDLNSVTPF